MKPFKVKVPATVSNIGPGYDVLGFAVDLFLTIEVKPGDGKCSDRKFSMEGTASGISDEDNALSAAFSGEITEAGGKYPPVDITAKSEIPLKMGLGSSAAARVGGIIAAAKITGNKKDSSYIARQATLLEGHPDNAVPATVGGLTVSNFTGEEELYFNKHRIETDLKVVLGIPDIRVDTNKARGALPANIDFSDAVYSNIRSCLLLSALISGRKDLIRNSVKDRMHQPYRKKFIPGFDAIVEKTYEAGALGTAISGSGPAIISFAERKNAQKTARAIMKVWESKGVSARYMVKSMIDTGAEIYE
ncbi:MAG: homoserine kinase [Elusimicrobia bacterium]|nr:homoserine kinase [Elusimicrobiota bacterium]